MQEQRKKILIIDDAPANIRILHGILQEDYETYCASSGTEGVEVARSVRPDLILLDVVMPEVDGYETYARIMADPCTKQSSVIFVTCRNGAYEEARGLESGAVDYLIKPVCPTIVKARVKKHLELRRQRQVLEELTVELSNKNQELTRLAGEDGLTGLANRRKFDEVLSAEIKRACRTGQALSLILCDIDFFKCFNDKYGHVAGDRCLQAIGAILIENMQRAGDLSARYGGEEFAVILPNTRPGEAGRIAEKLRQLIEDKTMARSFERPVTLSFGVVWAQPGRERTAEWYVKEADKALYESKEQGRNRVTVISRP